jgi:hypothetical protein
MSGWQCIENSGWIVYEDPSLASSLNDLIAHQEIISTLNGLIDAQELPPLALLRVAKHRQDVHDHRCRAAVLREKNYGSMMLEVRLCLLFVSS